MVAFSKLRKFSENLGTFSTEEIWKIFQLNALLNFHTLINVLFPIGMYDCYKYSIINEV